ncbi:hypothetical protein COE88_14735 [Bacillus toyonensis]|nr:hypothetical protein COE88_14735 [Bacillus toyonensis]
MYINIGTRVSVIRSPCYKYLGRKGVVIKIDRTKRNIWYLVKWSDGTGNIIAFLENELKVIN